MLTVNDSSCSVKTLWGISGGNIRPTIKLAHMVCFRIGFGFGKGGSLALLVVFHQLRGNVHWAVFSALKDRVNQVYCIIR